MKASDQGGRRVSAVELGEFFGVTDRTVRTLAQKDIISRDDHGLYALADSTRAYCSHLREMAAARSTGTASTGLTAQRERVAREQADALAMKNGAARAELLPAKAVADMWTRILRMLRSRLLALPGRIQQQLGHLTTHDLAVIDREIRDALTELGDDEL